MSVFGVSVQTMTLEIMSLLASNSPGRIKTYISPMEFVPEAIHKPLRHSGSSRQCFEVLSDAPSPPWSFAICSQTVQEHSYVLLKAPVVMKVHSGCYEI